MKREDPDEITGSKGSITFSVFNEVSIQLINSNETICLTIELPENIQLYHVLTTKKYVDGIEEHPSTGETALHTAWVMGKNLGRI